MLEFVNFFTSVLGKYVNLLFSLPLMDGVSVGSFMLGCAVFAMMLGYLLGRFLLSKGQSESLGSGSRRRFERSKKE